MKKWLSKKSNLIFVILLGFILFQQTPVIKHNLLQTNRLIGPRDVQVYGDAEKLTVFPPSNARVMAIFWASWCAPCKLEMERLKQSVISGKISNNTIFAINPFEAPEEIEKFIAQNSYPFTFIESSTLGSELGIQVTPTTVLLDNGKVESISSGMSIWGIWKAERFLQTQDRNN